MRIGVLDYGSGNLHSVCRALEASGATALLSSDHDVLRSCAGLVVPGVGAFAACMAALRGVGGDELILSSMENAQPVLGICVGHQIMFSSGVEHGLETLGLGILPGVVEKLPTERLPHMGWNEVSAPDKGILGELRGKRFYFVHSYAVLDDSKLPDDCVTAKTRQESTEFVAACSWRTLTTTQFHPEKSAEAGAELLRSWIGRIASGIVTL